MKALVLLLVLAVVSVFAKPAEATMDCTYVARGTYNCEETQQIYTAYVWIGHNIRVTQPFRETHPWWASAICYNLAEPFTMQFGRAVQDVQGAKVEVRLFVLLDEQLYTRREKEMICEGESPVQYAYVRGGVLWGDYGTWWWDFWCNLTDYYAGQCYHPNVFTGFYSWYLEHY